MKVPETTKESNPSGERLINWGSVPLKDPAGWLNLLGHTLEYSHILLHFHLFMDSLSGIFDWVNDLTWHFAESVTLCE